MARYGTTYGGWWLPADSGLNASSVVVSAGVGEDISFDLGVQSAFGCEILLIDPTPRAIEHVAAMREQLAAPKGTEYAAYIDSLDPLPNMNKIVMEPVGLWTQTDTLKFYKQDNPAYVSQSFLEKMFTDDYTIAKVERLRDILQRRSITHVDLLKMDIEGAEIQVLETMFEDSIFPRILCVEFDYYLKGKDTTGITKRLIRRLIDVGYTLRNNTSWNITFTL